MFTPESSGLVPEKAPDAPPVPSMDEVLTKRAETLTPGRLQIIRQQALFNGHVSRGDVAAMCGVIRDLRHRLARAQRDADDVNAAALADSYDEGWNAGSLATLDAVTNQLAEADRCTPEERLLILAEAGAQLTNPYAMELLTQEVPD
ncbi:MAG: hypothetical protein QM638_01065 [Nocardioides sp.]|uniref:hypothetical protein n=1 Tax=Nocardioides sp. TaxID=35761 RepID=UPI0039E64BE1